MVAELVLHADDGMGLDEAIAAYLAACDVEGKSPRTVDAYAETLGMFHAICLQRGLPQRVAEFRPAHVYAFLKVIADRGVSLGTRHRRFRETRAFFSWCTRMGGCARSPFTGIPNVKVEQKVIQPLTEGDIQALLAVCDSGEEFGCRNRAIILLFLDTGMRYAELHQLTLADVSWENRRIHIRHGRGRKQRVVPFGDGPEAALRDYVEGFRGEDDGPLFLTISRWGEPRRPMNKYLLGTLFARLLQRGVAVRHEPIRAWEGRVAPLLADRRRAKRRGHAGRSWSLDETDVHVAGRWCSLSRALDRDGGAPRLPAQRAPGHACCPARPAAPGRRGRAQAAARHDGGPSARPAGDPLDPGEQGATPMPSILDQPHRAGPPGRHAALSPAARLRELRVCCAVLFRVR